MNELWVVDQRKMEIHLNVKTRLFDTNSRKSNYFLVLRAFQCMFSLCLFFYFSRSSKKSFWIQWYFSLLWSFNAISLWKFGLLAGFCPKSVFVLSQQQSRRTPSGSGQNSKWRLPRAMWMNEDWDQFMVCSLLISLYFSLQIFITDSNY